MSGKASRVEKLVRGWAHGWEMFVEATRGPADGLIGPNPWGQTPTDSTRRTTEAKRNV